METVPIIYATFTGNTEEAATSLFRNLQAELPRYTFQLLNVSGVDVEELFKHKLVIFGASTWEDDLNPDTINFLKRLETKNPKFSETTFAMFGLGDSSFEIFCAALPVIEESLVAHGGTIYPEKFTIDGYPIPETVTSLTEWAKNVVQRFFKI